MRGVRASAEDGTRNDSRATLPVQVNRYSDEHMLRRVGLRDVMARNAWPSIGVGCQQCPVLFRSGRKMARRT